MNVFYNFLEGSFENRCNQIVDLAKNESIRVNISSLLESNVGRRYNLHLCSALNIEEASGIATEMLFKSDLCEFPLSLNGTLQIDKKFGLGIDEINI